LSPFVEGKEDGGYKPERQVQLERLRGTCEIFNIYSDLSFKGDGVEEEDEDIPTEKKAMAEEESDDDIVEEDEGYDYGKELDKLKKNKK